jgi:hypothetical protein
MPVITNNPHHPGDLVLAEGYPYILIKVVDPETGGVELTRTASPPSSTWPARCRSWRCSMAHRMAERDAA